MSTVGTLFCLFEHVWVGNEVGIFEKHAKHSNTYAQHQRRHAVHQESIFLGDVQMSNARRLHTIIFANKLEM